MTSTHKVLRNRILNQQQHCLPDSVFSMAAVQPVIADITQNLIRIIIAIRT